MRRFLPLVLLALGGCASAAADRAPAPGPTATTADTAAVLATMRQLFDAMAARDSAALASIVTPAGTFAVVSVEGDSVAVTHASLARFVSNVGRPGPTLQERAWDPLVLLEGPFATVWTRYDFHIDGVFSHCGIDVFTLARAGGRWLITGGSYTVQRHGCPPSPPDAS